MSSIDPNNNKANALSVNEESFKVKQNTDILQQYLMQKSVILEKVKGTYLFPYILNMQYLVGIIENVKVTDDPIETLAPYLNTLEGINRTLKVNFNRENLIDWEVFKLDVYFSQTDWDNINKDKYFGQGNVPAFDELKIYLLIKIYGNSLDLIIFGIIDNHVIKQDKIQYFLDNDPKVLETKRELSL